MKKVAIYVRLSDEDQKNNPLDESESIQNQKQLLIQYVKNKGWRVFKVYSDDNYSGLSKNRPGFNEMIEDAKNRKIDIVLCKHQSRFSRDMEMVEKFLHRKFPQWGIRFISITDHVDTLDMKNKKSRQINGLVNEWYCEDVSEAIKATFKIKRQKGKFIGSFPPYGYIKNCNDKNQLVVDQGSSKIVKKIFHWYVSGYGIKQIAQILNDEGILSPSQYKRACGMKYKNLSLNGLWNKSTIRRMLSNEVYIGNMVQGRRKKVNYKVKKIIDQPKDQWICVPHTHEAIIDKKLFIEVQNRLKGHIRVTQEGKVHIFAGKVRCMNCKNTMYKVSSNGYEYLRCSLHAKNAIQLKCSSHSIRLDRLEELILNKIKNHMKMMDHRIWVELDDFKKGDASKSLCIKQLQYIDNQLIQQNKIFKTLYLDKIDGVVTKEQFLKLSKGFELEEKKWLDKKEKIKDTLKVKEKKHRYLDEREKVTHLTHRIVCKLIHHIEIGEKNRENIQKIKVFWNF